MFQSLWMFVDQQEEVQLDFFYLCEGPNDVPSIEWINNADVEGENDTEEE